VVLLTTAIALLVAGTAMLTHDLGVYRQSWASDLATEASILASSTTPALEFDDHDAAERALSALRARPEVQVAALYSANGDLYADYRRAGSDQVPLRAASKAGSLVSGEKVEVTARLVQNREFLGSLYLRARYDVMGRVRAYIAIFAIVIALSMSVAIVLSSTLQHIITAPMATMAGVARQIVERRDYSLRARKSSDDEIGPAGRCFQQHARRGAMAGPGARAIQQRHARRGGHAAGGRDRTGARQRASGKHHGGRRDRHLGLGSEERRVQRGPQPCRPARVADEAEISGQPHRWRRFVHADDRELLAAAEAAALRTGVLPYTEFRIVRPTA